MPPFICGLVSNRYFAAMNKIPKFPLLATCLLALAGCQTVANPDTQPDGMPYYAAGTEPFWAIKIDGGKLEFKSLAMGEFTETGVKSASATNGMHYESKRLTLDIVYAACSDGMSDIAYQHKVELRMQGATFLGCGGGLMPPSSLDGTSWRLVSLDSAAIPKDWNAIFAFENGRLSGSAGCNRLGASYSIKGTELGFGPAMSTKMACDGPRGTQELKFTNLLSEKLQISMTKADQLVWTSASGVTVVFDPIDVEQIAN